MFDPAQFARLAADIPSDMRYDKEARTRTALGRAYYGLFLAVRSAIRRQQSKHVDDPIHEHGGLQTALYNADTPDLTALAMTLGDLYDARMHADYHIDPDGGWSGKLAKPRYAERLARRSRDAIGRVGSVDFSPVLPFV